MAAILEQKEVVYVVSDSVGETAEFVVKAVATQFNGGHVDIRRNSYVDDLEDIEDIISSSKGRKVNYCLYDRRPTFKGIFGSTCKGRKYYCGRFA